MNAREKFHATMSFEACPNLKTEFGYWAGTIRRWVKEGLPEQGEVPTSALDGDLVRGSVPFGFESSIVSKAGTTEVVDVNVRPFFGLDSYLAKFPIDFSPRLRRRVIEEDDRRRVFTDSYGVTKLVTKEGAATWHVLEYPVKNRHDFHEYVAWYEKDFASRLPGKLSDLAAALKDRTYPIRLGGEPFGFTYLPRALMGEVGYMTALYDDPALIREMNEFFLDFAMEYWALILGSVKVDCVVILEDVAYRNGPMISPRMFEEFALPYTARLVDFVKQFGVKAIIVDCDGKIDQLIPLWVKAGITGMFPLEAVNDVVAIRDAFPRLQIMGGVNKRRLIEGNRAAIDTELRRIEPLLRKGGIVPHVDHAVSADIGWESFVYYRRELNDMIDRTSPPV
jgi:Uroporphyrinogen decarboxylase (URO-D)